MNTTNHTSPSGEDAANGAIGEREAFEHWITTEGGYDPVDMVTHQDGEVYVLAAVHEAWEAWQGRAALTAEKVAGQEPVGFRTRMPGFGWVPWLTDDQATIQKAIKDAHDHGSEGEALYAAPQQPAQSAEQDEPAAYLVRGLDCHNEEYATVWIKRANADAAAAAIFRASITPLVQARAASTQSTATQPAQTQVALTDEQRDAVEYAQQVLRQVEAGDGTFVGQCTEAIEGLDALLTAAYPEIGGKS
jgi:hypothetical protein